MTVFFQILSGLSVPVIPPSTLHSLCYWQRCEINDIRTNCHMSEAFSVNIQCDKFQKPCKSDLHYG